MGNGGEEDTPRDTERRTTGAGDATFTVGLVTGFGLRIRRSDIDNKERMESKDAERDRVVVGDGEGDDNGI